MRFGCKLLAVFSLVVALATPCCFAKEPPNLALAKASVVQYHDSGEYAKDFKRVIDSAMDYLKHYTKQPRNAQTKPAIILDIDETSLSNYHNLLTLDFGGTPEDVRRYQDRGEDPALLPTLALYQFAKKHDIAVIFLTGRIEEERNDTIRNLKKVGYSNWDGLILRDGPYRNAPAAVYKSSMRKKLTHDGYQIIMNIGDQESDFRGGYSGRNYKLPNPFYLIP